MLFNDYTDGSGVGLVVLSQEKDYPLQFQQSYPIEDYPILGTKLSSLPSSNNLILYTYGLWNTKDIISPEL